MKRLPATTVMAVVTLYLAAAGGGGADSSQVGVTLQSEGHGLLRSGPALCASCIRPVQPGALVQVRPVASAGFEFVSWEQGCHGTEPVCLVSADRSVVVRGVFGPVPNWGVLAVTVGGGGTITSNPSGIHCGAGGSICEGRFPAGTTMTLTVTPNASSRFEGWGLGCSGAAPECILRVPDGAALVTGAFTVRAAAPPPGISVPAGEIQLTVSGPDGSSPSDVQKAVESLPSGLCASGGSTCTDTFPAGSFVQLEVPSFTQGILGGSIFPPDIPTGDGAPVWPGWGVHGGACVGAAPTCPLVFRDSTGVAEVTLSLGLEAVKPVEVATGAPLYIDVVGAGTDGVNVIKGQANTGVKNCTAANRASCRGYYGPGATVTLAAVPATRFRVWGPGACSGSKRNTCTVQLSTAPNQASAVFHV